MTLQGQAFALAMSRAGELETGGIDVASTGLLAGQTVLGNSSPYGDHVSGGFPELCSTWTCLLRLSCGHGDERRSPLWLAHTQPQPLRDEGASSVEFALHVPPPPTISS